MIHAVNSKQLSPTPTYTHNHNTEISVHKYEHPFDAFILLLSSLSWSISPLPLPLSLLIPYYPPRYTSALIPPSVIHTPYPLSADSGIAQGCFRRLTVTDGIVGNVIIQTSSLLLTTLHGPQSKPRQSKTSKR